MRYYSSLIFILIYVIKCCIKIVIVLDIVESRMFKGYIKLIYIMKFFMIVFFLREVGIFFIFVINTIGLVIIIIIMIKVIIIIIFYFMDIM